MNPKDRERIGYCIIIVMSLNIVLTIGAMTYESVRDTIKQIGMYFARKNFKKVMAERKA